MRASTERVAEPRSHVFLQAKDVGDCPERVRTTGGAGTAGLAAVQLGRRYVGIDIAAGFHDEALARLAPHLPDPNHEGGVSG
jgi:hypothetical protein